MKLKRELWAKLLRTAFGKAFSDDEDLFIDHTLLVLTAEIIAHGVAGFEISAAGNLTPHSLARGTAFADALIYGVVEADFFDWVLDADGGPEFVRSLADRVSRFDWAHVVEHDVLKILYESVIPASARASLGEYYTPDWLADRVVDHAVESPLEQRVLDPSCGSGTFLFHAIRRFLAASEEAGIPSSEAVSSVVNKVIGMDVHPVAVTLARVTYLLAIGRERLSSDDRGAIAIPVYLGDSMQWEQHADLLGGVDEVSVSTTGDDLVEGGGGALFGDDLVFPRRVLQDAAHFDRLVTALANRAQESSSKSSRDLVMPILFQYGVHETDIDRLVETFDTYAPPSRHRARPHLGLLRPQPNPPTVALRTRQPGRRDRRQPTLAALLQDDAANAGSVQAAFQASEVFFQEVWSLRADLRTLFAARVVELYLRQGGRFSLVMPHGTLTRQPHDGFRSGQWGSLTYGPEFIFREVLGPLEGNHRLSYGLVRDPRNPREHP